MMLKFSSTNILKKEIPSLSLLKINNVSSPLTLRLFLGLSFLVLQIQSGYVAQDQFVAPAVDRLVKSLSKFLTVTREEDENNTDLAMKWLSDVLPSLPSNVAEAERQTSISLGEESETRMFLALSRCFEHVDETKILELILAAEGQLQTLKLIASKVTGVGGACFAQEFGGKVFVYSVFYITIVRIEAEPLLNSTTNIDLSKIEFQISAVLATRPFSHPVLEGCVLQNLEIGHGAQNLAEEGLSRGDATFPVFESGILPSNATIGEAISSLKLLTESTENPHTNCGKLTLGVLITYWTCVDPLSNFVLHESNLRIVFRKYDRNDVQQCEVTRNGKRKIKVEKTLGKMLSMSDAFRLDELTTEVGARLKRLRGLNVVDMVQGKEAQYLAKRRTSNFADKYIRFETCILAKNTSLDVALKQLSFHDTSTETNKKLTPVTAYQNDDTPFTIGADIFPADQDKYILHVVYHVNNNPR